MKTHKPVLEDECESWGWRAARHREIDRQSTRSCCSFVDDVIWTSNDKWRIFKKNIPNNAWKTYHKRKVNREKTRKKILFLRWFDRSLSSRPTNLAISIVLLSLKHQNTLRRIYVQRHERHRCWRSMSLSICCSSFYKNYRFQKLKCIVKYSLRVHNNR